mmetsp:Transcript_1386/g.2169  ORF Transcript_1386/g.2169 Transcript_1386/m.2169 type:complete len:217 (-) Transcript_1386:15-665(-)
MADEQKQKEKQEEPSVANTNPANPGPDAPYDMNPKEGEQILKDGGILCHQWMFENLRTDPVIHYLMQGLSDAGCPISFNFFKCIKCEHRAHGYFDSNEGINLCSNYVSSRELLAETMKHELVHAYDVCRAEMKPICSHIACSEIRASNLSGECGFFRDMMRGTRNFSYRKRHKACVRDQALRSIQTHPACQGIAEETIDKVWNTCIEDLEPFRTIP